MAANKILLDPTTIKERAWTDKDGQERRTTEIVVGRFNGELVLLDKRESVAAQPAPKREANPAGGGWDSRSAPDDMADEVPF